MVKEFENRSTFAEVKCRIKFLFFFHSRGQYITGMVLSRAHTSAKAADVAIFLKY